MVDLQSQHSKIQTQLNDAIANVIQSAKYINGPQVAEFSKNLATYLDVPHVIPCANGTDALQIAMMALNLKQGDEVIIPAFTYVATAEVIKLLNLTPILVDVNEDDFLIDVSKIEQAITANTKAIVPVHLFGQCANMDAIMQIAQKHNLYVIEDTAQAIGATYTFANGKTLRAGTIGDVGCTSFFPSKNLGCLGDGGAMFTRDENLAKRLKMIANHGQSIQYHHDDIGVNSRLDTIQAAILNVKLQSLTDCENARNKVAKVYDEAIGNHPNFEIPIRVKNSTHVFHQYTLKCKGINRDDLRKFLAEKQIPSMVYYPIPLHAQKAYQSNKFPLGSLPVTENLCTKVISLPMSPEVTDDQLTFIINNINEFCKQNSTAK
ncbi:MAG: DegT/DnrJ/EryC1/StrS family aminotransferase [Bacteroidia bacterium]|nr:DegT/DnrJ/EryC1/StrS family aminotransferase [Bacteroidia bacterium]MBP9688247.1 DegT/DnrJ/EryC1/StrS family aminotransferase [Bacteroidia bacterium]